jgi:hypothetical protein
MDFLDLSNEVVDQVFYSIIPSPRLNGYKHPQEEADIRSLRLTCKRLASIGLRLIFHAIDLGRSYRMQQRIGAAG